jgi:hypothetical protein
MPGVGQPRKKNGLAVASLICGILGFLCFAFVPAIICGHMALSRLKAGRAVGGRGMAIAGLVLGYMWLALTVIGLALFSAGFMQAFHEAMQRAKEAQPSR